MGSEVVVVKRNRRRAFALLWAIPAWLRTVAMGARALLDAKETAALGARSAALGQAESLRAPILTRNAEGQHACTGCQSCVEVCPSRCLEIDGKSAALGGEGIARFTLDVGRCINCGDCVSVCPETALAFEPLGAGFRAVASGAASLSKDLLFAEADS